MLQIASGNWVNELSAVLPVSLSLNLCLFTGRLLLAETLTQSWKWTEAGHWLNSFSTTEYRKTPYHLIPKAFWKQFTFSTHFNTVPIFRQFLHSVTKFWHCTACISSVTASLLFPPRQHAATPNVVSSESASESLYSPNVHGTVEWNLTWWCSALGEEDNKF